jgi:hypothetical protein
LEYKLSETWRKLTALYMSLPENGVTQPVNKSTDFAKSEIYNTAGHDIDKIKTQAC